MTYAGDISNFMTYFINVKLTQTLRKKHFFNQIKELLSF